MAKLNVPSVQHLARNWHPSPAKIEEEFVKMALNPPRFSYSILNDIARDCLLFGIPEEQIVKGIEERESREWVQKVLLEIVPLLNKYFADVNPDFVHDVAPNYYSIGRDLKIPFKSAFIYGVGGRVYLPWPIFWKNNPMDDKQFSLFVTLASEILHQDPDLEQADFEILDFSAKGRGGGRRLSIIDAADVPVFDAATTADMLSVFVDGFERAEKRLVEIQAPRVSRETDVIGNEKQLPLWGK